MHQQSCKPHPLASSDSCDLWMCADCGTINLGIGPVSLRLKPEHFKDIAVTMQDALQTLVQINTGYADNIQHHRKINH